MSKQFNLTKWALGSFAIIFMTTFVWRAVSGPPPPVPSIKPLSAINEEIFLRGCTVASSESAFDEVYNATRPTGDPLADRAAAQEIIRQMLKTGDLFFVEDGTRAHRWPD